MANAGFSSDIRLSVVGEATLSPAQIRERVETVRQYWHVHEYSSIQYLYSVSFLSETNLHECKIKNTVISCNSFKVY